MPKQQQKAGDIIMTHPCRPLKTPLSATPRQLNPWPFFTQANTKHVNARVERDG